MNTLVGANVLLGLSAGVQYVGLLLTLLPAFIPSLDAITDLASSQYLLWPDCGWNLSKQIQIFRCWACPRTERHCHRIWSLSCHQIDSCGKLEVKSIHIGLAWKLTCTRWVYYIYLIMMSLAIVVQILFYRPPNFEQLHGQDRTRKQELKRVDWVGIFLLVSGLILFLLGISWGT